MPSTESPTESAPYLVRNGGDTAGEAAGWILEQAIRASEEEDPFRSLGEILEEEAERRRELIRISQPTTTPLPKEKGKTPPSTESVPTVMASQTPSAASTASSKTDDASGTAWFYRAGGSKPNAVVTASATEAPKQRLPNPVETALVKDALKWSDEESDNEETNPKPASNPKPPPKLPAKKRPLTLEEQNAKRREKSKCPELVNAVNIGNVQEKIIFENEPIDDDAYNTCTTMETTTVNDNDYNHDPNDSTIPESASSFKREATQKVAAKDWAGAAKLYQKSRRALSPLSSLTWPQHEEFALTLHSNLALCFLKVNKPRKALQHATLAEKLPMFENPKVAEGLRQKILARKAEAMVQTLEQEKNNNNKIPADSSPPAVWAILDNAQRRGYLHCSKKGGKTAASRDIRHKFFTLGGKCQALTMVRGSNWDTLDTAEKALNAWTDQPMRSKVIPLTKAMQARKQYQTLLTEAATANQNSVVTEAKKVDLALAALETILPQSPQISIQDACGQVTRLVHMGMSAEGVAVVRRMLQPEMGLSPTQSYCEEDQMANIMWALCCSLIIHPDRGPGPTRTFCAILKVLIQEYHLPIDQRGHDARSPLAFAAKGGSPEAVAALLEHGAQVNLRDAEGWTALHAVCMIEEEEFGHSGPSSQDRIETARILLQAGAELEAVSYLGITPLLSLCPNPDAKLLEYLIVEHGVNVNHRSENGWTALYFIEKNKDHIRPKSTYKKCLKLVREHCGFKNRETKMLRFLQLVEEVLVPVSNLLLEQPPWRVLVSPRTEQELAYLKALLQHIEMDPELLTDKAADWSCHPNNNENKHGSTNWLMEFHQLLDALIPSAFRKLYCKEPPTEREWGVIKAAHSEKLSEFEKKSNGFLSFDRTGVKDLLLEKFRNRGDRVGGIMETYYNLVIDPVQHCVGFGIPSDALLDCIASLYGPIVEVGAGTGYWTAVLQSKGVDCLAFDLHPPTGDHKNIFFDHTFVNVEQGDATKPSFWETNNRSFRVLLIIWPNNPDVLDNPHLVDGNEDDYPAVWDADCLQAYLNTGGQTVIFVGEREENIQVVPGSASDCGVSASRRFQTMLQDHFELVKSFQIPTLFPFVDDATIWVRKTM